MDLQRVRRLAWVLVASELRSGRRESDPRSFLGQPIFLLVLDIFLGGALAIGGALFLRQAGTAIPGLLTTAVGEGLPALPLFCLGGVVLAGLLFELNRSTRFSGSDAANWLPLTPREYVLASAGAVAYSDSLIAALAGGAAVAVGGATGDWGLVLLTVAVCATGLLAGALLVEMIRATTQRASAVLSGRSGRAALVGRAALFIVVILIFEAAFNPVLLLQVLNAVTSLGGWSALIPVFWAPLALEAVVHGAALTAGAFAGLAVVLTAVLLAGAAELRVRFWSPAPAELKMTEHTYSETHPVLAAFGLSGPESAIVAKDLRGLTRRREMLPVMAIPAVLLVVIAFTSFRAAGSGGTGFLALYAGWIGGFASLMMATTSFGQERRSLQTLYQLPLSPGTIYRAKVALPLLFGMAYAVCLTAAVAILTPTSPLVIAGLLVTYIAAASLSTLLGIALASRYSDFQERPRPQFIRPWAMMLGMVVALPLNLGITAVAIVVLTSAAAGAAFPYSLAIGVVVFTVTAGFLLAYLARSGAYQLLRELPI